MTFPSDLVAEPKPRPSDETRIRAALWFAERGFGIFPVWSTRDDGACRCPDGPSCSSPGKHPVSAHGFQDATTDPARIRTFLSAASHPNYGMVPPEGVFVWDVDSDEERARLTALATTHGPLPPTLRSDTANGQHVFWRWPDDVPRPLHKMFGLVTRWGSGRMAGYVIGPRSVHATGREYAPAEGTSWDIATLPETWARASVEGDADTIRITSGGEPEGVPVGARHDFLRDTARRYASRVREPEALFAAVWAMNLRLDVPKSEEEVRRAIGDVLAKFPADPPDEDEEAAEQGLPLQTEPGMLSAETSEASFPGDLADAAWHGTLADIAAFLADGTDASRTALLGSLLAFCGPLAPAVGYWNGLHPSAPFIALVGETGEGRKGTAMFRVRDALGFALGHQLVNRLRLDGLASGEALVQSLLQRASETTDKVANGLLFEEEYGTFIAAASRDGSSLDQRLRVAFDGRQLALRRVRPPDLIVPEPYFLAGLVAITPTDLRKSVQRESFYNGSSNRWIWLPVRRREVRVPSVQPILPDELAEPLRQAESLWHARGPRQIDPTADADTLLAEYDAYLRAETVGTGASMSRRYPPIAFRIALVHASIERSTAVSRDHAERAIALTEYARAGLPWVFGDTAGDRLSTYLLRTLIEEDGQQLAQSTISKYLIRDSLKRQDAIDDLQRLGLAEVVKARTGGRRRTVLRLLPRNRDFRDFCALFGPPAHNAFGDPSVEKRGEVVEKGRVSSAEGAQKVRRSAPGEWLRPCRDYGDHLSYHRRTPDGWVCDFCIEEAT